MAFRIRNAQELFETAETRKLTRLRWVPVPNKHDGKGYRRILKLQDGPLVYAAWVLILQVASKCPTRWLLVDDDGPIQPHDLADKTGFPVTYFELAYKYLPSKEIAWLEETNETTGPRNSPEVPATTPEPSGTKGTEPNRTEWNGIELTRITGTEGPVGKTEPVAPVVSIDQKQQQEIRDDWTLVATVMRKGFEEAEVRRVLSWAMVEYKNPGEARLRMILGWYFEACASPRRDKAAFVVSCKKDPRASASEQAVKALAQARMDFRAHCNTHDPRAVEMLSAILKGIGK